MKNNFLPQDYALKLDSCFLKFRDKVYWCRVSEGLCFLYNLWDLSKSAHKISPLDLDLDISSIKLGFFNNGDLKSSIYAWREPYRKTKQGVSNVNTSVLVLKQNTFFLGDYNYLLDKAVAKGFEGGYPSISRAIEMMHPTVGWFSVSISPDLALCPSDQPQVYRVYFRGKNFVGEYDDVTKVLSVPASPMGSVTSSLLAEHPWIVV